MSKHSKQRILVLGGSGMAGSAIVAHLAATGFEVHWTHSREAAPWDVGHAHQFSIKGHGFSFGLEEAENTLVTLLEKVKPFAIVNALRGYGADQIAVHAGVPLLLERFATAPIVHISSNGVFRPGEKVYSVADSPNAVTEYGLIKYLGERSSQFVIRASIIGFPLHEKDPAKYIAKYFEKPPNLEWNGITNYTLGLLVSGVIGVWVQKEQYVPKIEHICSIPEYWGSVCEWMAAEFKLKYNPPEEKEVAPLLLAGYLFKDRLKTQIKTMAKGKVKGWTEGMELFKGNLVSTDETQE